MRCNRSEIATCVIAACAFILSAIGQAQAHFTRFANYSDEQGLGNASVSALAQDPDGYVLLGTEAGLFRYDGDTIAAYDTAVGLPAGAWIRRIMVDDGGRVWVVTSDDIFVRYGARFRKVDLGAELSVKSPHLVGLTGTTIVVNNNDTLLRASIGDHDVGPFKRIPLPAGSEPILERSSRFVTPDAGDAVLVGCGTGICRIAGQAITRFGPQNGLPSDAWLVAVFAPDGTLWTRSLQRLAWRLPGGSSFESVPLPDQHAHTYDRISGLIDLVPDGDGGILTQGEAGLLDWDDRKWRSYMHHDGGLAATPIESLMLDREGSFWAGSLGHGVFRSLGIGTWEHWTADDGLGTDLVWGMTRLPDGEFWVATYGNTVRLDGKTAGVPGGSTTVKATRGGRLWTTPPGMPFVRLDPANGRIDRIPSIGHVLTAHVDDANALWLCSTRGLFVIPDADAPASGLHVNQVWDAPTFQIVADPAGTLWALGQNGLSRRGTDGRFHVVATSPLPNGQRGGLAFAQDGTLWVSTESDGILRFRVDGDWLKPLPAVLAPVLGSNDVLFMYRDRRGWMWVGTDHGLDLFNGRSWRRFDKVDGLISNDMDQWAVYEDTDGSMWFGTSHGLTHLVAPDRLPGVSTLHPRITQISIGMRGLSVAPAMQADWSSAPLVIRFADLDFTRGHVSFRYRLRGLDTAWNDTAGNEARYAGLPAGNFEFELVAVDTIHNRMSDPIGFRIHIKAPWWRRWWFYGVSTLVVATVLVGAWLARERLLLRQQKRLEDMVDVRTAEIEQARLALHRLALSDALTGLPNRRAIMATLEQTVAAALRDGTPLGVLIIDIDHFKRINDGFGHIAGDNVLATFGKRLDGALLAGEAAGRYGGEEFLAVFPQKSIETVLERIATIQTAITEQNYTYGGAERTVTCSGGVAFLRTSDTPVSLIARADVALYAAKENGRNRIEREGAGDASDQTTRGSGRSRVWDRLGQDLNEFAIELRAALAADEFSLHYQPVVDMENDVVTSCEALLRWTSPTRGRVSPADFIPRAESCGMMPEIGDWVLRTACREATRWPDEIKIAVNLSPMQFRLPDLVERVLEVLRETGLPPRRLELEITETAVIEDMAAAVMMIRRLKEVGVSIALDDFGTGYSSLSFVRTLPFDRIKIDRSFVNELGVTPVATAIINAISGLARTLGASVTAEGAETEQQIMLLRELGCLELQGFGVGRPCPAPELQAWMSAFSASRVDRRVIANPMETS